MAQLLRLAARGIRQPRPGGARCAQRRAPAHDAVTLTITRVFTPRLGHHVYYAQEMAADDPRRVLSQKMYSFQVNEKRGIIETTYAFAEPRRWRDGQQNKELFTSVVTEDVQPEACDLIWKAAAGRFVATHDPKVCPDPGGGAADAGGVQRRLFVPGRLQVPQGPLATPRTQRMAPAEHTLVRES